MSKKIHSTAIVDSGAELGDGVIIGPYAVIERGAVIGDGSEIGQSAWISGFVRMGRENKVFHGASIGGPPQDKKFSGEFSELIIGDRNMFRESTTMNRGTKASGKTIIGSDCMFMAYSHVAHDCVVGDNVIFANCSGIGGHVTIGNWVILGGSIPVHQFVTIGDHVMVGMSARISRDVPPYLLLASEPTRPVSINVIGLRRRGFSDEDISALKKAYRLVYRCELNTSIALDRIVDEVDNIPVVNNFVEFIRNSTRGIIR